MKQCGENMKKILSKESISSLKNDAVVWLKKHRKAIVFSLLSAGAYVAISIIAKQPPSVGSDRWIENATEEELNEYYDIAQNNRNSSGDDSQRYHFCEREMKRCERELRRRIPSIEGINKYPIHGSNGLYLLSDD